MGLQDRLVEHDCAGADRFALRRSPPVSFGVRPHEMRIVVATGCMLKPLRETHAREMLSVLSDPAIYEFENQPPSSGAWLTRRFERLEGRCSEDGTELWLNWIVRLAGGEPAGYVQATVLPAPNMASIHTWPFSSRRTSGHLGCFASWGSSPPAPSKPQSTAPNPTNSPWSCNQAWQHVSDSGLARGSEARLTMR